MIKLKDKRGSIIDVVIWIALSFAIVVFFGMYLYGHQLVTDTLEGMSVPIGNGTTNISMIAMDTFGQVNTGLRNVLPSLAFALIMGMVLTILLSNFLIKSHPAFFFAYVGVTVLAIALAAVVSNRYEELTQNAVFGSTLLSLKAGSFIMLYLPVWATVIGLMGALFLFIGMTRDREFSGPI